MIVPAARAGEPKDAAMADEATASTDATAAATAGEAAPAELGDAGKQALDRMKAERDEARKQAKALSEVERRLKEYEDRDKTEAQKLAERVTAAEQERDALLLTSLRQRVALEKGLPAALADRLKGGTEEEMSADADDLLALVPNSTDGALPGPRPDLSQGARSALALNGDPLLQSVKNVLGIR